LSYWRKSPGTPGNSAGL